MVLKEKPSPFPGILQISYTSKEPLSRTSQRFFRAEKRRKQGGGFLFRGIKKLRTEKSASQFYGISQYLLSVKVI